MKTVYSLALLAAMALPSAAFALSQGLHAGADQNQQSCSLDIQKLKLGPVKYRDACDFEMDGPGPWCDHSPKVAVRQLSASGVIVAGGQTMAFTAPSQQAIIKREGGNGVSFTGTIAAGPDAGALITFSVIDAAEETIQFHLNLKTAKALAMTGEQISAALHAAVGVNYTEVYKSLFIPVTCSARLQ